MEWNKSIIKPWRTMYCTQWVGSTSSLRDELTCRKGRQNQETATLSTHDLNILMFNVPRFLTELLKFSQAHLKRYSHLATLEVYWLLQNTVLLSLIYPMRKLVKFHIQYTYCATNMYSFTLTVQQWHTIFASVLLYTLFQTVHQMLTLFT